jgi:hypothetical protein
MFQSWRYRKVKAYESYLREIRKSKSLGKGKASGNTNPNTNTFSNPNTNTFSNPNTFSNEKCESSCDKN